MKRPEANLFLREILAWTTLSVMLGSYVAVQLYERAQHDEFIGVFEQQTEVMQSFLDGWSKYQEPLARRDQEFQILAKNGNLPPFSCEAVFIREHHVVIDQGSPR